MILNSVTELEKYLLVLRKSFTKGEVTIELIERPENYMYSTATPPLVILKESELKEINELVRKFKES